MYIYSEQIGSAGLTIRIVLEIPEHHRQDLMRWPMGFTVDRPGWVIDEPQRFRSLEWVGVVTMNANPDDPGQDPGRPDEEEVKEVFHAAIQPLEDNMKGQRSES